MPSRRSFLGTAVVALSGAVATAGCVSVPTSSGDPGERESSAVSTTPETTDRATIENSTTAPSTTLDRLRRVRGEAEPITVEETITDSEYVYVESNDTVRYPAIKSGDKVLEYGYESFEDWARNQGATVGVHAIYDRVDERVDGRVGGGTGGGPDGSLVIYVRVTTRVDRDGNVVSEPNVPVADLVAETPRSVTSTVYFAGNTATHTHEVWVRHVTLQND